MEFIRSLHIGITQHTVTCFSWATSVWYNYSCRSRLQRHPNSVFTVTVLNSAQEKYRQSKLLFECSLSHERAGTFFCPQWYDLRCFQVQDLTDEPKLLSRCQFPLGGKPLSRRGPWVSRASTSTGPNGGRFFSSLSRKDLWTEFTFHSFICSITHSHTHRHMRLYLFICTCPREISCCPVVLLHFFCAFLYFNLCNFNYIYI